MSKNKRRKKPTHNFPVRSEKKPHIDRDLSPDNINLKKLAWKFCHLDFSGPWSWLTIDSIDKIKEVKKKMKDFETMTWGELQRFRKNSPCNPIPLDRLCNNARNRLRELKLDDIEDLYELHITGQNRIWGIKDNELICLLWWDPNHEVCPVKKKHT